MTSWILAGLVFLGVLLDGALSLKRLKARGVDAERNPLIRKACEKFGLLPGMLLGLVAPWVVMLILLAAFHCDRVISFWLGVRTLWAVFQIDSMRNPQV
jgi:hypothetical protein